MKKDDKQPDKPKKKPQPKAASKSPAKRPTKPKAKKQQNPTPTELTVTAKPRILNLDSPKYKNGLTVSDWQKLAKTDRSLLTQAQIRQLDQTNKMFAELANQLTARYDFATLFKGIDTLPMARLAESINQMSFANDAFRSSLIIPSQQLVSLQQSLALTGSVVTQSFAQAIDAANITRSLFADMQRVSDIIIKGLSIDLASLGASLSRFTPVETIDLDVLEVIDRDGNVAIVSETSQTKRIDDNYQFVSKATFDLLLTEIRSGRQEVAELKQLIKGQLPSGITKITYADIMFMIESSKLMLKGYEIDVQRSSKQAKFCDFFFSSMDNFVTKWDVSRFMELAFTKRLDDGGSEATFNSIVKGYVNALNGKIAVATQGQITDFFVLFNYEVYVNPRYLPNL